jgi:hypothetical protein
MAELEWDQGASRELHDTESELSGRWVQKCTNLDTNDIRVPKWLIQHTSEVIRNCGPLTIVEFEAKIPSSFFAQSLDNPRSRVLLAPVTLTVRGGDFYARDETLQAYAFPVRERLPWCECVGISWSAKDGKSETNEWAGHVHSTS